MKIKAAKLIECGGIPTKSVTKNEAVLIRLVQNAKKRLSGFALIELKTNFTAKCYN